jgi:signal transduction histidine kinase
MVEYLGEIILMAVDSYIDKDVAEFDSDVAYHGAATAAEGVVRNIRMARALLYGTDDPVFPVPRQLSVAASGTLPDAADDLHNLLRNAFAYGNDILSQIERSISQDSGNLINPNAVTDKLLADVILQAVRLIEHQMIAHSSGVREGYRINKIIDLPKPPPVRGAPGDLISVFKNIFENSVKYRRSDRVLIINVGVGWDREKMDYVTVNITDNGIGVKAKDVERIFTRRFRTKEARYHRVHGDGLGLAYCRDVLKSYGGDINAESHDGRLVIVVKLKIDSGGQRRGEKS